MKPEEFTIEQHKMLRDEVMGIVAETRRLEVLVLGALAAFYGWIFTHEVLDAWVWSIPPVLALMAGLRCLGLYKRISEIAEYLKQIEAFVLPTTTTPPPPYPTGWEHFRSSRPGAPLLGPATLFWILLILFTALGGWHFSRFAAAPKATKAAAQNSPAAALPAK